MYDTQNAKHKRSVSHNDSSSYESSLNSRNYIWNTNRDKLQNNEHEQRLKEQARRFISRIRKQKEYNQGRYLLMRQKEEFKRQQGQSLISSLQVERREMQRSKKMTDALEKILVNQCKREQRIINQLTQKIRQQAYQQNDDQIYSIIQQEPYILPRQVPKLAKKFKTVQSQKYELAQNKMNLPLISTPHEQKQKTQTTPIIYIRPAIKVKEDKQRYLNKLDQLKLKSIDSKIKKLNKLFNQSHQRKL